MDGLMPKTLVVALESLLEEKDITSWNIISGEFYTQVTIRLGQGKDQYGRQDTASKSTKYRRVPPSQVQRDTARAADRRSKLAHNGNFNVNNTKTPYLSDQLDVVNIDTADSQETADNIQYCVGNKHNAPAGGIISHKINTDGDISAGHNVLTATASGHSADSSPQDIVLSYSPETDKDFNCEVCEQKIDTDALYYVCALCCDPSGIFPICDQCNTDKKHDEHKPQVTRMTDPTNEEDYYCSQCGYIFPTESTPVYACAFCREIQYELCHTCFLSGLHPQHKDCFQKLRRKDLQARDTASKLMQDT